MILVIAPINLLFRHALLRVNNSLVAVKSTHAFSQRLGRLELLKLKASFWGLSLGSFDGVQPQLPVPRPWACSGAELMVCTAAI